MTKAEKIQNIKEIFHKPDPGQIRIFIQPDPAIKKEFYKSIPATGELDLIALDAAEAENIYNSLKNIAS